MEENGLLYIAVHTPLGKTGLDGFKHSTLFSPKRLMVAFERHSDILQEFGTA